MPLPREAGAERGGREEQEPEHVGVLAAEEIGEAAGRQHEHGRRDHVDEDHPDELQQARVQAALEVGQRDDQRARVDGREQHPEARAGEHPPLEVVAVTACLQEIHSYVNVRLAEALYTRGGELRPARTDPPLGARALPCALPAARARRGRDADRHRRHRRHRAADGLRARLRALARLPAGRPVPEEGLPLVHRVLEPRRRVLHGRHDARACGRRAAHPRPRAPRQGARLDRLRRDARTGAARRDHRVLPPQPVPRDRAPLAVARGDRSRRARPARLDAAPARNR